MPVVNKKDRRIEELVGEVADKLGELCRTPQPAPVVNVAPAEVSVNVPKSAVGPKSWVFSVQRDSKGLIETITAKPLF
jgi:hypothetical protein